MSMKNIYCAASLVVLPLALAGCDRPRQKASRETILDKVVSIPKEFVLDIPHLPPLCDELPGLKKGFVKIKFEK